MTLDVDDFAAEQLSDRREFMSQSNAEIAEKKSWYDHTTCNTVTVQLIRRVHEIADERDSWRDKAITWNDNHIAHHKKIQSLGLVQDEESGEYRNDRAEKAEADLKRVSGERDRALNRHVQFMITGGPVVMSSDFDKLKSEKADLERQVAELREALRNYAECGDGCTCGNGWSHNVAIKALEGKDNG